MTGKALVLGGGGVVGIAWETGVLKGLQDAGLDPADADLIIGTSAGSTVGAQLAAGRALDALLAVQLGPSDGRMEQLLAGVDPQAVAEVFQKLASLSENDEATRAAIGSLALAARTPSEAARLEMVAARLGVGDWPQKRLLITAVDAASGAFTVWDRSSGVSLAEAVASSGAVPGMFPPTTIQGRRYIDGGIRSITSADLARGHDMVLVIAPVGRTAGALGTLQGQQIAAEVAELEQSGARVVVIEPDATALEAFGPNLMDPARRAPAAEAGLRQGAAAADALHTLWSAAPV